MQENMDRLINLQAQMSTAFAQKVDVHCNEDTRIIGVFPAGAIPIPINALRVIQY
jgi:hypothetical protein